jgi:hypothetical protein
MDQELKSYLDAKFSELGAKFSEVDARFSELDAKVSEVEARLALRIEERIEKSENNLLRAFHGWARSMEIRVRGVSSVAMGFEERLSLTEERISEVERRQAS